MAHLLLAESLSATVERITEFFRSIGVIEVIEIIAFAMLFYFVSKVLHENDATKLMIGYWFLIVGVGVMSLYAKGLPSGFYFYFLLLLSMFLLVIFSVEIKKNLWDVHGPHGEESDGGHSSAQAVTQETVERCIVDIIKALQNMSKNNVGALIVLSKGNLPKQVLQSGVKLEADISTQLIEGVFFPKAPLHDGAMIIRGHRIQAAGCFLPLTQKTSYPKEFGTRHRAGIGITEVANVVSLIVSEETGIISVVRQGNVQRYADYDLLQETLRDYYWQDLPISNRKGRNRK